MLQSVFYFLRGFLGANVPTNTDNYYTPLPINQASNKQAAGNTSRMRIAHSSGADSGPGPKLWLWVTPMCPSLTPVSGPGPRAGQSRRARHRGGGTPPKKRPKTKPRPGGLRPGP